MMLVSTAPVAMRFLFELGSGFSVNQVNNFMDINLLYHHFHEL
jgi:hypothetical protein